MVLINNLVRKICILNQSNLFLFQTGYERVWMNGVQCHFTAVKRLLLLFRRVKRQYVRVLGMTKCMTSGLKCMTIIQLNIFRDIKIKDTKLAFPPTLRAQIFVIITTVLYTPVCHTSQ